MALLFSFGAFAQNTKKPNILVIWGDDVGYSNISINSQGMMGYQTPNIDHIGKDDNLKELVQMFDVSNLF